MKKYINGYKMIAVLLLIVFTTSVLPINNLSLAQAKGKIELSDKSLILNIGDTEILTLKGTTKKAVWTSSDDTIVTVNNKGIVLAKNVGNAEITAIIQKKKYTCKVVVLRPENPYIATAPFKAKGLDVGDISVVVPDEWNCENTISASNTALTVITPSTTDISSRFSGISVVAAKTGVEAADYSALKDKYIEVYTEDQIKKLLEKYTKEGETVSVSEFITSDYISSLGTACKFECNATFQENIEVTKIKLNFYILNIDNYLIIVQSIDAGDNVTPDLKTTAEYLLNSIQVNE